MVRYSTGYGFRFRASGFRAAARVRQAGRFTRHTFRVNLPCQPAPVATLACLPPEIPCPITYRLRPTRFDPARAVADGETLSTFDTSATNGNHRQQSTTRRGCLCYRLIDTAAVALRRRSAPLRSAVCSLRSRRVGRALVAILAHCLGFGVLSP